MSMKVNTITRVVVAPVVVARVTARKRAANTDPPTLATPSRAELPPFHPLGDMVLTTSQAQNMKRGKCERSLKRSSRKSDMSMKRKKTVTTLVTLKKVIATGHAAGRAGRILVELASQQGEMITGVAQEVSEKRPER